MKAKHITAQLVGCVLMTSQAWANQNLVDTLPKVDSFNKKSEISLTIEKAREQDQELKKMLETVIKPSGFGIKGVKSIPFDQVSAYFTPYVQKEITVGKLVEITQQVTALYREKGYPLSFCYLPKQDFTASNLLIVVIEGFIEHINIEGNPGGAESKMRDIGEHLLAEKPLTQKTMERYVSLLSQLPGLRVQADLQLPQKADGGTDLTLNVKRRPIDAYGRAEVVDGFSRINFTAKTTALTPLAEQITFSSLLSKNDEEFYAGTYTQPIGTDGLLVKFDGSSYVGDQVAAFGPGVGRNISSNRFGVDISYPFYLTLNKLLNGNVSFYSSKFTDSTSRTYDFGTKNAQYIEQWEMETDVRAFSWGVAYSERIATQSRAVNLVMTKGIDGLGSSKKYEYSQQLTKPAISSTTKLNNPYDIDFFKLNAIFNQKDYFFYGLLGTSFTVGGQYSGDMLPITERIIYGGYSFGRAYRPGKIAGDSGVGASFEVNSLIPLNYSLPLYNIKGFQPYILFESAWAEGKDQNGNKLNVEGNHIMSGSLGVRVLNADSEALNVDFSLSQGIKGGTSRNFFDNINFGVNFGLPN
ncbi:ShlB/FhaC/HecB family hemolysin secretion/activation protein [Methylomicrobium lacus]|uniref:ShlB/FhaC/HecB family hemolysin secretion/activation protein n=1 Tax=Methylomicrobium lacus TaxID=136992 RepID=UPI0035A8710F